MYTVTYLQYEILGNKGDKNDFVNNIHTCGDIAQWQSIRLQIERSPVRTRVSPDFFAAASLRSMSTKPAKENTEQWYLSTQGTKPVLCLNCMKPYMVSCSSDPKRAQPLCAKVKRLVQKYRFYVCCYLLLELHSFLMCKTFTLYDVTCSKRGPDNNQAVRGCGYVSALKWKSHGSFGCGLKNRRPHITCFLAQ